MKRVNENPIYTVRRSFPKGKKPYYVPLYGGLVYFCTSEDDFAQVYDYMTSADRGYQMTEGCLGCVCPLTNEDGQAAYVVGVFDGGMNTYVHELGHLAIEVLDRAGCPIDNHTSEAFCYLIGALTEHFEPQYMASRAAHEAAAKAEEAKEARAKKREVMKAQEKADAKAAKGDVCEAPERAPKPSKVKGGRRGRS